MSTFLPTGEFKWIDPTDFDFSKYSSNSSESCVLEVDPGYPKELLELHNDYPLAPDKIEIKEKICCLVIKKQKEKYMLRYLRLGLKHISNATHKKNRSRIQHTKRGA